MTVQLGADVVALFLFCFAMAFALGALIAYLFVENHYHR